MGNSCICTSSTARDTDDDWRTHRRVTSSSMTFQKESRQVQWRKELEDQEEKKKVKRTEDDNKADKCSSEEDLDEYRDEFLHKVEEDRIAKEKIIFAKFLTDEGKLRSLSWRPALPSIPEENPEAFFRPWVL